MLGGWYCGCSAVVSLSSSLLVSTSYVLSGLTCTRFLLKILCVSELNMVYSQSLTPRTTPLVQRSLPSAHVTNQMRAPIERAGSWCANVSCAALILHWCLCFALRATSSAAEYSGDCGRVVVRLFLCNITWLGDNPFVVLGFAVCFCSRVVLCIHHAPHVWPCS